MMKIGLLGGSFNPAHQGHIYISELAVQKLGLNQVWWIPTAQNPFKEKATKSYIARINDCLEITRSHPKICVKNFEKDSFFTYGLVKKLRAQHPEVRFYFIMGADNLEKFHLWKNFLPLIKLIEFAIFSRADFLLKAKETKAFQIYQKVINVRESNAQLPKFLLFKTKNCNISSSAIRNKS